MASDSNIAGISRSGSPGSYAYSAIAGSQNKPITYVSWGDAARFANWLANGQPSGAQGPGTTEAGSYALNGAVSVLDLSSVVRNTNATWVIPTENEWYKAAYYNPASSSYYTYPFSSSSEPTSNVPGNTLNTGNFSINGGYAVAGPNHLTDVGAYTASGTPYGAFDMGGNVFQWNETSISTYYRGLRGGGWSTPVTNLPSSRRPTSFNTTMELYYFGFRVASVPVPEPNELEGDFNDDDVVDAARLCSLAKDSRHECAIAKRSDAGRRDAGRLRPVANELR
jgi:formylglycine-generating enzyme required for sulfatase activity